jgi:hypothetical protein
MEKTSLFSAPQLAPLHVRTDLPTPEINPFHAPAFREVSPEGPTTEAEDLDTLGQSRAPLTVSARV